MKKYHAYVVKWRDSSSFRGWQAIDNEHEVATITSVGWLARETPKEITITTSISWHGNVIDAVTIPREAVTKMTKLKNYVAGN